MDDLFRLGDFTLHSGAKSAWKIDCDALTDGDLAALGLMIKERVPAPFGEVIGVPRGGLRLADYLYKYRTPGCLVTLIVDDVMTTGASMNEYRKRANDNGGGVFGAVIFARGSGTPWVDALFRMEDDAQWTNRPRDGAACRD